MYKLVEFRRFHNKFPNNIATVDLSFEGMMEFLVDAKSDDCARNHSHKTWEKSFVEARQTLLCKCRLNYMRKTPTLSMLILQSRPYNLIRIGQTNSKKFRGRRKQ